MRGRSKLVSVFHIYCMFNDLFVPTNEHCSLFAQNVQSANCLLCDFSIKYIVGTIILTTHFWWSPQICIIMCVASCGDRYLWGPPCVKTWCVNTQIQRFF